jgi:glycerol kinase
MRYVLALDAGTTSSRAILFDEKGAPKTVAQREFPQIFPQPGWVEHDAKEILATQRAVAREAVRVADISLKDLMAIGITNQRETTIVWDRQTGEPIANAIVWQDRRTAPRCEELKQVGAESLVRERTGLVIDPYFSGTKIGWLLDNVPGARARAERGELAFGTVDTWLTWHLTGNRTHVTDVSNASRTLLFNIHMNDWDEELLALFGVPRAILPDVHLSTHAFGMLPKGELGEPIVIGGIAGDQQAATFGQGCHKAGMAKNTYGTGCFMLLHTGDKVIRSRPPARRRARPASSRSREACSSAAPWCSGCEMAWNSSALPRRWRSSRRACSIRATSMSCPPSPASARRTGIRMRAARSSASRAARRKGTSPAPRWSRSLSRARSSLKRCRKIPINN